LDIYAFTSIFLKNHHQSPPIVLSSHVRRPAPSGGRRLPPLPPPADRLRTHRLHSLRPPPFRGPQIRRCGGLPARGSTAARSSSPAAFRKLHCRRPAPTPLRISHPRQPTAPPSSAVRCGGDGHRITDVCWVGALVDDACWSRTRDEAEAIFRFGHGANVCPGSDGRGHRRPGLRHLLPPAETPHLPGTALAHTSGHASTE
jgi:hypothetical protein